MKALKFSLVFYFTLVACGTDDKREDPKPASAEPAEETAIDDQEESPMTITSIQVEFEDDYVNSIVNIQCEISSFEYSAKVGLVQGKVAEQDCEQDNAQVDNTCWVIFKKLQPNTYYTIMACAFDEASGDTSKPKVKTIKTPALSEMP